MSGVTAFLASQTFKMHSTGFISALAFATPTSTAELGAGVNEPLGYLVPPLLLTSGPDLFAAASLTGKVFVDVIAAFNEIRLAIAIARRKILDIYRDAFARL
jgi:hypothetical protein